MVNYLFADLCAGIGGFRLGLEKLGWKCAYSCDIDPKCGKTYQANFNELFDCADINNVDMNKFSNIDVICAGFPCQPFSIAGKCKGFSDPRGETFFKLANILKETRPSAAIFENVPNLASHDSGITFQKIVSLIQNAGYSVYNQILDSANYGVPQHRKRLFIICFRDDLGIDPFTFNSIFMKKGGLPQPFRRFVNRGDYSIPISKKWQYYIDLYTKKIDIMDVPFKIPKTRLAIERQAPYIDLNDCIFQMRSSGIRALDIDKPLPTFAVSISGGGAMIPVYSKERRHLSLIEMKRMMGFPDNYKFPVARTFAIKQLANAVCPQVVESIGSNLEEALG
ncbi:MAG: DNA cytosine methyltransferase [Methanothrix sp.]|nr:DNA cytosine methyltransferase [Methanothrix sp.]